MNLPTEIWYKVFSFLSQKSQSKFSSLWNLHDLSEKEIKLMWKSNHLWLNSIRKGYAKLMKLLIENGIINNVNIQDIHGWTALHLANQYGHKDCVELLIKSGTDVSIRTDFGWTALHWASRYGHKECAKVLIKAGSIINLNIRTNRGNTALHIAIIHNHKNCVETLIKAGTDLNIQNNIGNTPLHEANNRGHKECVKLLEKKLIKL